MREEEGNRADPDTRAPVVEGRSGTDRGCACVRGMKWAEGVGSGPTGE